MENISIALNQKNQDLSSGADFNKGLEKQLYNSPTTSFTEYFAEIGEKRKRELDAEVQRQQKAITQAYFKRKMLEAHNLKIAYAILAKQKDKIELIPNFELKAFVEVVKQYLVPQDIPLLAERVSQLYEDLNDKINKINACNDMDLYYQYHEYDPNFESVACEYNGEPVYEYGDYVANSELLEMEVENKLLMNLSCELAELVSIEPSKEEITTIKQALEA